MIPLRGRVRRSQTGSPRNPAAVDGENYERGFFGSNSARGLLRGLRNDPANGGVVCAEAAIGPTGVGDAGAPFLRHRVAALRILRQSREYHLPVDAYAGTE